MFMDVTDLPPDPLAGTRYRFVRVLGCGGSSDVFEAAGPSGERFAIKVLRETFRDIQQYATRFLQEGRILAAIDHPHIVPLREIGMTRDGRPFLVMPRMPGQPLSHYLEQHGPLEPNTAAMLLAGALDGLQEAHRRGVVHRDVKPENIFVVTNDAGTPEKALIFDFGIAKISGAAAHRTTGDRILGTPRYVSPEQIFGGRLDGRIDVYAMGIVLFESIAARGPYDLLRSAQFDAIIRAHLSVTPRRLDDLSPASAALACVIARALEKAPGKRFASAGAFADSLRKAVRFSTRNESNAAREGCLSC